MSENRTAAESLVGGAEGARPISGQQEPDATHQFGAASDTRKPILSGHEPIGKRAAGLS